ncbi:Sulfite exporter TauE/SafE family protein 4 [Camellia lanceoleosa]|uniref:Sulfite exporter TauE/SafE family protein 4 n=1 Tax=Camellia lanceoleosa TaxID=1840588 RepID=A0ACC0HJ52_9ERIC|nr:Sulfite exporter TauE/SafE family protein 4 [Camellia lanceoleosa]
MAATRGMVLYLLSGFSIAVLSVLYISDYPSHTNAYSPHPSSLNNTLLHYPYGSESKVWPELKFSWRIVLATVIGFLGSACGTVGGVGGGGIFVPMLTLIVGFDTKSAAALSKCMIMGASASSVWYNLRVPHPCREVPILDYDLALLFQPMLMLGITIGVALSVVFPYWLITVLIIILFLGTSSRSFFKGIEMWKEETILKKELVQQQETVVNSRGELLIDTEYEPLIPREEKTAMQILRFNLRWKRILVLLLLWAFFLLLQIIKNDVAVCSTWYWLIFLLQFPLAFGVFGFEGIKLYKESKQRRIEGNTESVCEATLEWTPIQLAFCGLCGILGGTVGGLLGSGGGFILGPLLLEIGVIPQVASATATFVMLFSSSLSVVEFYLLKRFPIPYALYLISVSVLAGFWGQFFIRKLVAFLKRASLIVFILSAVIFASALTMGVVGIDKSIKMIHNHEFMGFLGFCSSQ